MTKNELALERLYRNGILSPFSSVELCVKNLVGIQSQVLQFAELAILNRCLHPFSTKDLDKLYYTNSLISLWGQRHTLHTYTQNDRNIICDIYCDKTYIQNQLPLYQKFLEEVSNLIQDMVLKEKILKRSKIDETIRNIAPEPLKNLEWLSYMILGYLCANGLLYGIPAKPSIQNFTGYSNDIEKIWQYSTKNLKSSLDEILLRYFQFYGPATIQDFKHWSGLPLKAFREAFENLIPKLNQQEVEKRTFYSFGNIEVKNTKKLSLLGKFDPLFVAYKHKEWIATSQQQKQIWRKAGHVEAVILEGTKFIGTWRHILKGNKMTIFVEPISTISISTKDRIYAKSAKLAKFWMKGLNGINYK